MNANLDILPVTIRPAVPEDFDGIARIYLESAEYHARLDPERYAPPAFEAVWIRYHKEPQDASSKPRQQITLVAERGGEVVGFADVRLVESPDAMHRPMTYCYIEEIAVAGQHQSQGIGGQLLGAAEDWGRQRGAAFASLEFNAANVRAGAFYRERMGYRVASLTAIKRL